MLKEQISDLKEAKKEMGILKDEAVMNNDVEIADFGTNAVKLLTETESLITKLGELFKHENKSKITRAEAEAEIARLETEAAKLLANVAEWEKAPTQPINIHVAKPRNPDLK